MSAWVALAVVFVLGCILGWGINGNPEPGYESLWYVAVVIAGAITTGPVIVYLALKWLLDKLWKHGESR
jgi:hypothetical protein